jgi:hypothetical protein
VPYSLIYVESAFKTKDVLKVIVDFAHSVDWSGRHETPAGKAGLGRPRRRLAPRRLPDRPRKAKCLERKSTDMFNTAKTKNVIGEILKW